MQIPVSPKISFPQYGIYWNIAKLGYFTIKSHLNIECHKFLVYTTV